MEHPNEKLIFVMFIGFQMARFAAMGGPVAVTDPPVTGPAKMIRRDNVVWTSPAQDATGVMPIGTGDMAAGVYAITNDELYPVFPFRCDGLALGSGDIVDWTMKHRTSRVAR